jgi:hypothetical protein
MHYAQSKTSLPRILASLNYSGNAGEFTGLHAAVSYLAGEARILAVNYTRVLTLLSIAIHLVLEGGLAFSSQ